MRREYKCDVTTGAPQVAYRETITRPAKFDYTHKKQTGGSGQYAKVVGEMRPMAVEGDQEKVYNFVNSVVGGRIPKEYIPSCDKGFQSCMEEGIRAAGEQGARYYDIGNAIQDIADEHGFSVVEDYCGHGIGRGFHEEPTLYHFRNNVLKQFIEVGNVFTIEPMINVGRPGTKTLSDGWTAVTRDGSLSAQWEHTVARTKNGIEILTLPR